MAARKLYSMTIAGKEIIGIFKLKQKFTLIGNREFWEILTYENGKIINTNGETLGNKETVKVEVSAAKALKKIKEYFKKHSQTWENKSISKDTEILEYWKRWNNEG